ncbi:MAG TPA: CRISPR-associated endonuclease Cas2 [Candidatus Desulfofervidus auxilii]|uniref:CRISPR-associated endoribonuclease Cas2 n=1 Tax=Desulfofervidus auxilii TaxID=1621989 RepID=A0A7C0Y4D6_DESA2|nr:CRISPR-associated endonuclease Cas2 [Candidatus Desulfofervidus auxilii]
MFVIMVYDVEVKRVNKVLKTARKYLYWVQNSVLEGDISPAKLEKLKSELKHIINEEKDSIVFYTFRTTRYSSREIMGIRKGGENVII